MEKEIDTGYILSSFDTVTNVNDKSVFSIKTHLVLIDKLLNFK